MITILNYREAKQVKDNYFELEIETEEFGWIPTAIDLDNVENLPHMVVIAQWLIDNESEIEFKGDLVIDVEVLLAAIADKVTAAYNYVDFMLTEKQATFFSKGSQPARNRDRLIALQAERDAKKITDVSLDSEELAADLHYANYLAWSAAMYTKADEVEVIITALPTLVTVAAYNVITEPSWPEMAS